MLTKQHYLHKVVTPMMLTKQHKIVTLHPQVLEDMIALGIEETSFLEASLSQVAVGVVQPSSRKLISVLTEQLTKHFEKLYAKFPMTKVLAVIKKKGLVKEAAVDIDAQVVNVISDWATAGDEALIGILQGPVETALAAGWTGTLTQFLDEFGVDLADLGILPELIPATLSEEVKASLATLVKDVSDTTIDQMTNLIASGLARGDDVAAIARAIADKVDDPSISSDRAMLIAQTEVNRAISAGAYNAAREVGAKEKEWVNVGDDRVSEDICLANTGQGKIKFRKAFQSGDHYPPGHPDCRCTVVYTGVDTKKLKKLVGVE